MTKAQLLAVGSTAELEPAEGCDTCKRLQVWARSSWARGHQMGMAENRRIAREATEALRLEREAHAETNARLTEALLAAEDEIARLRTVSLNAPPSDHVCELNRAMDGTCFECGSVAPSNAELTCGQQPAKEE